MSFSPIQSNSPLSSSPFFSSDNGVAPATPPPPSSVQLPTGHLPRDPLDQLLELSHEEIYRKGIPQSLMSSWKDQFYEGLDDGILLKAYARSLLWAIDNNFFKTKRCLEKAEGDAQREFSTQKSHNYFLTAFSPMTRPEFWRDPLAHKAMLPSLYRLYHTISFPLNNPVEKVFIKLLDCLIEKIVEASPDLQKVDYFSRSLVTPDSSPFYADVEAECRAEDIACYREVMKYKQLFCIKTQEGWRVGASDRFPKTPLQVVKFNMSCTKMAILDESGKSIDRPCAVVTSNMRPYSHILESVNKKPDPLLVTIVLCEGIRKLYQGQRNATTFVFDIDRTTIPFQMTQINQFHVTDSSELVTGQELQYLKEEAEIMFQAFQTKLASVKSYSEPVVFELTPPKSAYDQLWVRLSLLSELQKDPKAHADLIAAAATLMDCDFSEAEIQDLVAKDQAEKTEEGYEISSKAVIDKLVTSTKSKWTIAMKQLPSCKLEQASSPKLEEIKTAPSVAESSSCAPSLPEQETENAKFMQQRKLEKQVEKERRRAALSEQKKQTAREQAEDTQSEVVCESFSMFGLGERDQNQAEAIYHGKPMNAKNFATFAMGLLRKKATVINASVRMNTKGSHPKLHFKRENGTSGGVTFRIHHGGDKHGHLHQQKDTLDRIFAI